MWIKFNPIKISNKTINYPIFDSIYDSYRKV